MSPATSAQVRRRHAARREALQRQQRLNEDRRRRDEIEIDLAADFALSHEEWVAARAAVVAAELAMGRVVDQLVELRVRYPRAAQLLEVTEEELRRLRQLATEAAQQTESTPSDRPGEEKPPRQRRQKRPRTSRPASTESDPVVEDPVHSVDGTEMLVGGGEQAGGESEAAGVLNGPG